MNADELLTALSYGKMIQYKTSSSGGWTDFYPEDEDAPHVGKWLEHPTPDIEWRLKPRNIWN